MGDSFDTINGPRVGRLPAKQLRSPRGVSVRNGDERLAFPRAGDRHWNLYIAVALGIAAAVLTLVVEPDLFPAAAASVFSLVTWP